MVSRVKLLAGVLFMLLFATARADAIVTIFGNAVPQTTVAPDAKAVTLRLEIPC
jgi:hypothetical protein